MAEFRRTGRRLTGTIGPPAESAGYALTDALVALLILASTLGLSFSALTQARDAAELAREFRQAQALLSRAIISAPRQFQPSAGSSEGFTWTVETTATGADAYVSICRRAVSLHSDRSGRDFEAATLDPCPLQAAS